MKHDSRTKRTLQWDAMSWVSAELRLPLFAFLVDATGLADSCGQSPNCAERVGEAGHTKHVKHSNGSSLAGKLEGKAWESMMTHVRSCQIMSDHVRSCQHGKRIAKLHWRWIMTWWLKHIEAYRSISKHIEAYRGTEELQPRHSNEAWVDGIIEWWIY